MKHLNIYIEKIEVDQKIIVQSWRLVAYLGLGVKFEVP